MRTFLIPNSSPEKADDMTLPPSPNFSLQGKRALVLGASSGIGLGCAVAVARSGAETVLCARREELLQQTTEELLAEGHQAQAQKLDFSDIAAMEAFFQAQQRFDIVVNSAGMARHGPALETRLEDFRTVMQLNLEAAYFCSIFAARAAIDANKPLSIVHISSQMGKIGGVDRAVYCASKHGLEGMIKAMAIEWGKKSVRINAVLPTFVHTALTASTFADPERLAWVMDKIKLDRVAEVEDIAGAVLYLASSASSMVTGTSLLVDGGWTAG